MAVVRFGDMDSLQLKMWRKQLTYQAAQGRFGLPGWFVLDCLANGRLGTLTETARYAQELADAAREADDKLITIVSR